MHFVYGFCNGNTTAAVEEYRLRYPRRRNPDRCVFTRIHQVLREKGSFPGVNRRTECHVQRNLEVDENIIDMVQRSLRSSTRRISARFCVPRMRVWRTLHAEGMYPYHIITPEPLPIGPTCMWRFWLSISSAIKPRSTDLTPVTPCILAPLLLKAFSRNLTLEIVMKIRWRKCTFG